MSPKRQRAGSGPRPSEPSYPLGSFSQRLQDDLVQAGYGEATIRGYSGHVRRFASHHMRSPEDMGHVEVVHYLIHMVEDHNASLGNYRAARVALRALYRVSLRRPEEVEHIPTRPERLRQLADLAGTAAPTAAPTARPVRSDAVMSVATVS